MPDKTYRIHIEGREPQTVHADTVTDLDLVANTDGTYHLLHNGQSFHLEILHTEERGKKYHLKINGHLIIADIEDPLDQLVDRMGLSDYGGHAISEIEAPMPGLVLQVDIKAGDTVEEGQALLILEAMKMENVIKSPVDAVVAEVLIESGQAVENGQVLIRFE